MNHLQGRCYCLQVELYCVKQICLFVHPDQYETTVCITYAADMLLRLPYYAELSQHLSSLRSILDEHAALAVSASNVQQHCSASSARCTTCHGKAYPLKAKEDDVTAYLRCHCCQSQIAGAACRASLQPGHCAVLKRFHSVQRLQPTKGLIGDLLCVRAVCVDIVVHH